MKQQWDTLGILLRCLYNNTMRVKKRKGRIRRSDIFTSTIKRDILGQTVQLSITYFVGRKQKSITLNFKSIHKKWNEEERGRKEELNQELCHCRSLTMVKSKHIRKEATAPWCIGLGMLVKQHSATLTNWISMGLPFSWITFLSTHPPTPPKKKMQRKY